MQGYIVEYIADKECVSDNLQDTNSEIEKKQHNKNGKIKGILRIPKSEVLLVEYQK